MNDLRPMNSQQMESWVQFEKAMLAACMHEEEGLVADHMIEEGVEPNYFYKPTHKIIWGAIRELRMESKQTNEMMVFKKLVDLNMSQYMESYYLNEISSSIESYAGYSIWMKQLKEFRDLYVIWKLSHCMQQDILDSHTSEEILVSCNKAFQMIESSGESKVMLSSEYIPIAKAELDNPSNLTKGIATGFEKFDHYTGGLKPEQFIVIAARPGIGKSTRVMNLVDHVAVVERKNVLFFSAEMSYLELGIRQISARTMINQNNIRDKNINTHQSYQVDVAAKTLAGASIFVDDSSDITPSRIGARSRSIKNKYGLDLIVIDYLQIVTPDNPNDNREQQISAMTRYFKKLAGVLKIPVIALSQLNRGNAKEEREPRMSDLRESGAIEQDADIVLLIHEDEDLNGQKKLKEILAKQRNGETKWWLVDFHKYCFRIGNEDTLDDLSLLSKQPQQQLAAPPPSKTVF